MSYRSRMSALATIAAGIVAGCAGCGETPTETEVTYLNLRPRAFIVGSVGDARGRAVASAAIEVTRYYRNVTGGEVTSVGDCSGVATAPFAMTADIDGEFASEMDFATRASFDGCLAISVFRDDETATVTIPLQIATGETDTVVVTIVLGRDDQRP